MSVQAVTQQAFVAHSTTGLWRGPQKSGCLYAAMACLPEKRRQTLCLLQWSFPQKERYYARLGMAKWTAFWWDHSDLDTGWPWYTANQALSNVLPQ